MAKNKLRKFNEMKAFPNVFEPTLDAETMKNFPLKGKWRADYFRNDNPIVLELGCGKGEYTVGLAKHYPERNFIGVDIKGARMFVGAKEALDAALPNVAFLRTKIDFIETYFAWETTVGRLDSLSAHAQRQLTQQRLSAADLSRVRLASVNASLKLYGYRQELAAASARLQAMLHTTGKVEPDTADHLLFLAKTELSSLSDRSETRTDIQLLRTELDHAGSELHLQRSLAWPQPELGVLYNPQNAVPYVGFYGTIEIPVFSRNQGEISQAQLKLRQAGEELSAAQEQAKTEIASARDEYLTAQRDFTTLQQLVTESETLFRDVEQLGTTGGLTVQEVNAALSDHMEMLGLYFDQERAFGESCIRLLFVSGTIGELGK